MGLQTDLFLGSTPDAKSYDGAPKSGVERIQLGGLTNLEFEILQAIVASESWEIERHALEEIASTEASWTFRFPGTYVMALQSLDRETIERVAVEWAATEEIAGTPSDVLPVIEGLVRLAKEASLSGRSLFVWFGL